MRRSVADLRLHGIAGRMRPGRLQLLAASGRGQVLETAKFARVFAFVLLP